VNGVLVPGRAFVEGPQKDWPQLAEHRDRPRGAPLQVFQLRAFDGEGPSFATFFVMGQSGVVGDTLSPADASYLTDNMLLLRFFEAQGEVRKAISVVKKRGGSHEIAIRELKFGPEGITVGEALRRFQGILTGVPIFTGAPSQLMQAKDGTGPGKQEG
jgi:hypothetical protein